MRIAASSTAVVALMVAACTACAPATGRTQTAPPASAADTSHDGGAPADVAFMRGMIAHHGQAVVMTALVPTHTQNRALHLLAQRIEISQRDEMATMRRWLEDRGENVPDAGHGHDMAGMDHAGMAGMGHDTMPGMLSPEELARLQAATGAEFDRLFLRYMIRHHEGALAMVARLLATPGAAQEPQLFGFASDVDADQRAEIARMQAMLGAAAPARPQ
jgi:uncharacterized protein (DUF305 family)